MYDLDTTTDRLAEETLLERSRRLILDLQEELTGMKSQNHALERKVEELLEEVQINTREKLKQQESNQARDREFDELIESKFA